MPCIQLDRLGTPCRRVELVEGTQYCKIHFGRMQGLVRNAVTPVETQQRSVLTKQDVPMSSQLKGFYANKLSPKLASLLSESAAHGALNNLRGEIELLRSANLRAVQVYDSLSTLQDSPEAHAAAGGGIEPEQIAKGKQLLSKQLEKAADCMRDALRENAVAEERYANVLSKTVDRMPPDAMQDLVKQVIAAAHHCFGRDWEGLQKFDKMLSDKLNLPSVIGTMGTHVTPATITPTQQVTAMIGTVPRYVEREDAND